MNSNKTASKKTQAQNIINGISKDIISEFEKFRDIQANTNTKGGVYEKTVSKFFTDYLGSRFDFHTRAHLLDINMEYLELLSLGQNEIDVVATFNSAYPKIIVKLGDVNFVAYDSVAFLAEIKTTLDKTNLTKDLKKFEKISGLPLSENKIRMGGGFVGGNYVIERPLRILFYFDSEIQEATREELLVNHYLAWDIMLIVQRKEIVLNSSLPMVKFLMQKSGIEAKIYSFGGDNTFIMLMLILAATIPFPETVPTINTFLNLDTYSKL
jgi:hypothetical protein